MTHTSQRPPIEKVKTSAELEKWYWLKSELVSYARENGVGSNCRKPELLLRIGHWLDTGEIKTNTTREKDSTFNWRNEPLSTTTVITDNYSNTQNMRSFMKHHTDNQFRFSNEFMDWMRSNNGKTLGDALSFWQELDKKKRQQGYREKPLPQNQYNQFTRALSENSPGISAKEIKRIWSVKRSRPGPHVYKEGDENL